MLPASATDAWRSSSAVDVATISPAVRQFSRPRAMHATTRRLIVPSRHDRQKRFLERKVGQVPVQLLAHSAAHEVPLPNGTSVLFVSSGPETG